MKKNIFHISCLVLLCSIISCKKKAEPIVKSKTCAETLAGIYDLDIRGLHTSFSANDTASVKVTDSNRIIITLFPGIAPLGEINGTVDCTTGHVNTEKSYGHYVFSSGFGRFKSDSIILNFNATDQRGTTDQFTAILTR